MEAVHKHHDELYILYKQKKVFTFQNLSPLNK